MHPATICSATSESASCVPKVLARRGIVGQLAIHVTSDGSGTSAAVVVAVCGLFICRLPRGSR
jgi:hypothetical protein